MGQSRKYSASSEGSTTRVRQDNTDNAKQTGDRYTQVSDGHVHESYKLDTASGGYKEYGGGENADDRSYNK